MSRSGNRSLIILFALAIAAPTSGLHAQESFDSVVARGSADGATAAKIRPIGLAFDETELNAVRQKRVILFGVLGIAAGIGALFQIAGSGT